MGAATDLVTAGGAQKGAQFLTADTFSCENEVTELGCKLWEELPHGICVLGPGSGWLEAI